MTCYRCEGRPAWRCLAPATGLNHEHRFACHRHLAAICRELQALMEDRWPTALTMQVGVWQL
jgi:hypothetical protein